MHLWTHPHSPQHHGIAATLKLYITWDPLVEHHSSLPMVNTTLLEFPNTYDVPLSLLVVDCTPITKRTWRSSFLRPFRSFPTHLLRRCTSLGIK